LLQPDLQRFWSSPLGALIAVLLIVIAAGCLAICIKLIVSAFRGPKAPKPTEQPKQDGANEM
jgi:hypothetical protein